MTTQITPKHRTVIAAQGLFMLNAAIWLIFGIAGIMRLANGTTLPEITLWVVTILMFGNVGAMLLAGFWLGKRSRWAFGFALAVLVINLLLTFTDQVGFFDILTALIDFGLLGLIIFDRKNYL
jgi:uncharacterized membrane protein YsdA (DUF1294 family)